MAKHFDPDLDSDNKSIKRLDKKKHHSRSFNEDVLENRGNRVNFKNYLRQIREQEIADSQLEEWAVIKIATDTDERHTVAVYVSEDEAVEAADELNDADANSNHFYKAEMLC